MYVRSKFVVHGHSDHLPQALFWADIPIVHKCESMFSAASRVYRLLLEGVVPSPLQLSSLFREGA